MARKKMRETKPEKECFAFNTSLIIIPIVVLMCIFITTVCFICAARNEDVESNVLIAVIFLLFGVFMIVLFPFSAYGYLFSEEGITALYMLRGERKMIPWSSVEAIDCWGSLVKRYDLRLKPKLASDLFPKNKRIGNYVVFVIPVTRRIKRLMKRFYRRDIL